ncbi:hypothetical protein [Helicobacter cetorum]|uniref:Uncharacterized protein n=1 Tax=Helicobacter cetorum (strain ATCC BAA-540 / CCUG 52418 / MIT 99-5656) TaxID=1163745 RepID=I0ERC1_HELCM|nr:hypothetical protein [Helicobacter cetorum]AFI05490.1 hypothetical protein HCD_02350 [Helicobacter cetorum MIT 99-5656]
MKQLHFSHIDREQSGDVGFIIKNLVFLGIFSLFGWLNTEYFLWPNMLEFKKNLLEENRKKSVLEYAQRRFETALTNYRNQRNTSESLLKIFSYEESRRILDKILKSSFENYQIKPLPSQKPSQKAQFFIAARVDDLDKTYHFFTLLNKYLPSARSQLPFKISKDSEGLLVQFNVSIGFKQ